LEVLAQTSGEGLLWKYTNSWQHEISRHATEAEALAAAQAWLVNNQSSSSTWHQNGATPHSKLDAYGSSDRIFTTFGSPSAVEKINLWTQQWEWAAVVAASGSKWVRKPD
jgi:hypothetical protein